MEKIFITGGAGFIGSNLAELLSSLDFEVVVYDNLKSGFIENINSIPNVKFINGDILDFETLCESVKGSSRVYHFAAEISVPESVEKPKHTEEVNTLGTINLLNAMLKNNVKNIVFASSAAVYGDSEECPKTLDMAPNPISPYAISKLSGEYYIKMFTKIHGFKGVVTRFFNVFGDRQNPNSKYAAAVPIFISKALKGDTITIFGDGEQTRDFIYVKDLVKYIYELSNSGVGYYNLGYGEKITINDLVQKIIKLTNSNSKVEYKPTRAGDVKRSFADVSKLKELNRVELYGFETGLARTIEYFKNKGKT
ncbi:MAG TPA: NAD-dependent epimerase/dehydratase family protein [Spirochaetota bacterium]|nr:NAD-dependent epimerase/dehydratase family protein [Spirochaetota bacterium]HOS31757.1 NAD-dependent epimerase/dehydratase family protein [Spirochaetota bacterium]HOS54537.1 NAD-dependent epimerase/dehydratase family protein [Spirochaetota bacterium]HPK60821.1 NAD-dependent epimerase/dehydratase family protein [Spirochaetota bacterium]HQF77179.1 NAD-dependent epimerase/dehydratase family protein [Spirochaetota bacterium]